MTNIQEEIWKPIPGFEGYYEVSSFGRVKTLHFNRNKVLKPLNALRGYLAVNLSVNDHLVRVQIHVLVAMAFLGHVRKSNNLVVDHVDFNRSNNRVDNLRLVTRAENTRRTQNTRKYVGAHRSSAHRWRACIDIDGKRKYIGYYDTEHEAAQAYQKELEELKKKAT